MSYFSKHKPVVLILAGHDPTGGAGIQADIETQASLDCIATTVVTSLTAQNTQLFSYHLPQASRDFASQMKLVLDDINIDACKIGAIGSPELVRAIHEILANATFPIILDPVLQSTTGHDFAHEEMCTLMCELLFPFMTVITPNLNEALLLSGTLTPQAAADKFIKMGCKNILITDAEASKTHVINHLYTETGQHQYYTWERLQGSFHGSGCTLSSAIAANLAKDMALTSAVEQAQDFTWNSLKHGLKIGQGQKQPNRFFNNNQYKDV